METHIRAAAYCRVSTLLEEQEGSFDLQAAHFTRKIKNNPDMTLVGIYGDRGKSGLTIQGRDGIGQMLEACEAGEIDLILTKSISRVTRNIADCSDLVRKLRELGVTIHFEKENILSTDTRCELLLNIFTAIAQAESHSISQGAICAHRQYSSEGRPFGRVSYGYYNRGNNCWAIREAEAERVRTAFQMAAQGHCYTEILIALNGIEKRNNTGILWKQRRLKYLLRNVVYKGDYFSHRTVCLVPGHQVENRGYRDRYYIKEHHCPIVSETLFDWVQQVFVRGILASNRSHTPEDLAFLALRPTFADPL